MITHRFRTAAVSAAIGLPAAIGPPGRRAGLPAACGRLGCMGDVSASGEDSRRKRLRYRNRRCRRGRLWYRSRSGCRFRLSPGRRAGGQRAGRVGENEYMFTSIAPPHPPQSYRGAGGHSEEPVCQVRWARPARRCIRLDCIHPPRPLRLIGATNRLEYHRLWYSVPVDTVRLTGFIISKFPPNRSFCSIRQRHRSRQVPAVWSYGSAF